MNKYYQEYFERARQGITGRVSTSTPRNDDDTPTAAEAQAWYEEDLESIDTWDDSRYAGRSVSSADLYLGYYQNNDPVGSSAHDILNRASCKLVRLLNSVRNTPLDGDDIEKVLNIEWSTQGDEKRNTPSQASIVLNPEDITDGYEDKSSQPEVLDALGGKVLMAATLKRTMGRGSFRQASEDTDPLSEQRFKIWTATENAVAKQQLLSEWPGAAAYLWRHQVMTGSTQEQAEAYVMQNAGTFDGAVAALCWRLANPKHRLDAEGSMSPALNKAAEMLDTHKKNSRYENACKAADYLRSLFPDKPPEPEPEPNPETTPPLPPPSGEGEEDPQPEPPEPDSDPDGGNPPPDKPDGEEGNESKGVSASDDAKDGKSKEQEKPQPTPPAPEPKVVDEELFGTRVPSNMPSPPSPISQADDLDKFDLPEVPPGCGVIEKIDLLEPDTEANLGNLGITREPKLAYRDLCEVAGPLIKSITNTLRFRMLKPSEAIYGMASGDLDDGSLHKLAIRRDSNPSIFQRSDIPGIPDVSVGILVDESGSMGSVSGEMVTVKGRCSDIMRCQAASLFAIAMVEALSKLQGIKVCVWGHSQTIYSECSIYCYLDANHRDRTRLATIKCRGNNADGYAMQECIRMLHKFNPQARQKLLFVISDGQPAARCGGGGRYGGYRARKHMANVVAWGRRKFGVETFGLGCEGEPFESEGNEMYGQGRFVSVPSVIKSASVITRFLAKVTTKV